MYFIIVMWLVRELSKSSLWFSRKTYGGVMCAKTFCWRSTCLFLSVFRSKLILLAVRLFFSLRRELFCQWTIEMVDMIETFIKFERKVHKFIIYVIYLHWYCVISPLQYDNVSSCAWYSLYPTLSDTLLNGYSLFMDLSNDNCFKPDCNRSAFHSIVL